jgi:hypothetical protein
MSPFKSPWYFHISFLQTPLTAYVTQDNGIFFFIIAVGAPIGNGCQFTLALSRRDSRGALLQMNRCQNKVELAIQSAEGKSTCDPLIVGVI